MSTPDPVTITEKPGGRKVATCVCGISLDCPPSFGGILGQALLDAWVEQHKGHGG